MKIKNARFLFSLDRLRAFDEQGAPEIAMAGKSNVGKSSMINSLLNNSKLARISAEPGKTRLINFYAVNTDTAGRFLLVDLPGYGFARAPKAQRDHWAAMIEGYLENSRNLRRVLHLVDIRHEPTREDVMMTQYLRHYDIPFTVIATKADKLSRAAQGRSIPAICRALAVQPWEVVPYSSQDSTGREQVLQLLETQVCDVEGTPQ